MLFEHWHLARSLEISSEPCKAEPLPTLDVGPPATRSLMDRIATFRSFIAKSPTDPFPRYGLAMELKGNGQLAEAWAAFEELITQFPDYVATYLMAGGTLVALDRKPEAAEIYRKGIEVARRRGDQHARGELETALSEITPA
jgi:tetratricopeptide (TPR) repeat protein